MSFENQIDLSIVIVNYNTHQLIIDCIESIYNETVSTNFEIIIIDNASEQSPAPIQEKYPKCKLIQNENNLGFGTANNLGIENSRGKFILLLNSDTIIIDKALDKCVEFMESNFALENNIGLMGCKLIYQNGEHQNSVFYDHSDTRAFINSNPVLNAIFAKKRVHKKDDHFVKGISGAFMFFRASVFEKIKPFDPDIFMYSEETELCRNRVSRYFNIYYWTGATVVHFMGKSSNPEKAYQQNFLSYAFTLYKSSLKSYFIFLLSLSLNLITSVIIFPYFLIKKNEFELMRIKGNFVLLGYFLFKIPFMSRNWGSNENQLKIEYFRKK